ncbi:MAG: ATP-binding cassette domain-containing protein [Puniceicoccales bacterium]|nr:ATP-binding cassette domain-containing protein [Puniceicoccales bacterium]
MITLGNISKNYNGLRVVDNVSLEIGENVIYGLIGKSGAGKSTLIRMMSLLESLDTGEIYYDNCRVDNLEREKLSRCRRQLGMIFQHFNLFSSRNVFGNVAYPLEIVGKDKETIKKRVSELLKMVELSDKFDYPISKLSGGQKQRVAIARALANHPKFLFCDEATSALDPQTTKSVLRLIKSIRDKIGLTVVIITHQMEVVKEICDYVSIIDNGKIVENGTVKEVVGFPHTKIAREFISTLDTLEKNALQTITSGSATCRLHFDSESVTKPILSYLIRNYQLDVNILSGAIRTVNKEPLGELVLKFIGSATELNRGIAHLESVGVTVEVLDD